MLNNDLSLVEATGTLPAKALFQETHLAIVTQSVMPTTQVPVQIEEQLLGKESVATTSELLQAITNTKQNST